MVARQPAGSVLFVGDIQGCVKPLENLLRAAKFHPDEHQLIPVGDTINRGPHNVRVLDLLKSVGAEPILGNHELGLLAALGMPKVPKWLSKESVSEDLLRHRKLGQYLDWIESWPMWVWGDQWLVVHGGLHPTLPIEQTDPWYLATVRVCNREGECPEGWDGTHATIPGDCRPWYRWYRGQDVVIYGHWARNGLSIRSHTVGLDSGCVYGGQLSGMWFPSRDLVQVEGHR